MVYKGPLIKKTKLEFKINMANLGLIWSWVVLF